MGDLEITTLQCTGGRVYLSDVPAITTWNYSNVPSPTDRVVIPRNLAFAIPYASLLGGIAWAAFWYGFAMLAG